MTLSLIIELIQTHEQGTCSRALNLEGVEINNFES